MLGLGLGFLDPYPEAWRVARGFCFVHILHLSQILLFLRHQQPPSTPGQSLPPSDFVSDASTKPDFSFDMSNSSDTFSQQQQHGPLHVVSTSHLLGKNKGSHPLHAPRPSSQFSTNFCTFFILLSITPEDREAAHERYAPPFGPPLRSLEQDSKRRNIHPPPLVRTRIGLRPSREQVCFVHVARTRV
jgi:hypothetical protein